MWQDAGIIRHHKGLDDAISKICQLKLSLKNAAVNAPQELVKLLELKNMLMVSEVVCRSAMLRDESRGSNYRSDFPEEDNQKWLSNIIIRKENSQMKLEIHPINREMLSKLNIMGIST
jgi:succinate dehydrogenase/fumarate reductase flavoprotein subunit